MGIKFKMIFVHNTQCDYNSMLLYHYKAQYSRLFCLFCYKNFFGFKNYCAMCYKNIANVCAI